MILLALKAGGTDGTGRPPEFASRLLFHVPSSSIRGSPGSFAVSFVPGDLVGYMVHVFSFCFLPLSLCGDLASRRSPSHSRDTGVLQSLSSRAIWKLLSIRDLLIFWRPILRFFFLGSHPSHRCCLPIVPTAVSSLSFAFLLVVLEVTLSLFISFWVLG